MKIFKKSALVKATLGLFVALGLFVVGYSTATIAQHSAADSAHIHSAHSNTMSVPKEAGQSAFAALAEILVLLENDPDTDWAKVDLTRLRDHLVDMDALTLRANVSTQEITDGVEYVVTGKDITLRAIQSMVPAHANELNKLPQWTAQAERLQTGARLTMKAADKRTIEKIKALGFFGLMATGAHHQPHHLAMAKGIMAH